MDRETYMQACKHYSHYNGSCYLYSGGESGYWIDFACTGKCPRMKRYDKKQSQLLKNGNKDESGKSL